MSGADPYALAARAAAVVAARSGVARHDVGVVLGSGWGGAVDALGDPVAEIDGAGVPGLALPGVPGHGGRVWSRACGDVAVLALAGRVHSYEGRTPHEVVHGIRMMAGTGVRAIVLTNACGGLREWTRPGRPVLIRDHINLTGASPLDGPPPPGSAGSRFVDMGDCWSARLRALAREVDPTLAEGVYAGVRGPQYETPAEVAMLRACGADLVGMSTVLEAIAARHLGVELVGLALVTNAAGGTADPVRHEDVLRVGAGSAAALGALLRALIARLHVPQAR